MKFLKSGLMKKIIIILIALMIFNIAVPQEVKAWDIAGILFKPISTLLVSILVSIDVTIGLTLTGISAAIDVVGAIVDGLMGDEGAAVENASSALSKIFIGPDTIFSGKVTMLNANIFRDITLTDADDIQDAISDELGEVVQPGAHMVVTTRKTIANIYHTLRNICGFIMLAGLIFTGIRILVTSNTPTAKTKWLMILQDWLVGMVLLVFSHIIMIGVFYISDTLTDALSLSLNGIGSLNSTLIVQCLSSFDSAEQIICIVMLAYLIWLTVIFAISYFKRFLWVCVLTVFAPIVSVMYSFGGQTKSIYSNWLREYIMTVLVQPFHMIVYWVLVSVPLNMVNSTGGFSTSVGNSFEIIYALVAISFIRPAEKYIRQLFGMDKGIAQMASYDSGKQTFDAVKKAVSDIAKKVAMAIAIVYTGGAAAGAAGAAGGAGALGATEGVGAGVASEGAGAMLGQEGGSLLGSGMQMGDGGINEAMPRDFALDQYTSEGFGQNANGEYFNPWTDEYDANYDPHKDTTYNPDYDPTKEKIDLNQNDNSEEDKVINASNVTITAGNIAMAGNSGSSPTSNAISEELEKEDAKKQGINLSENEPEEDSLNEDDIDIQEGKPKKGSLINRSRGYIKSANDMFYGDASISDAISSLISNSDENMSRTKLGRSYKKATDWIGDKTGGIAGKAGGMADRLGERILGTEDNDKIKRALSNAPEIGKAFEELGGKKELYQGFNEIRDTFFATPAPQDWKNSVQRMDENKKRKDEKAEYNFVHDEGNKQFIIKSDKLMEKYRAQYPQKSDAYIESLAEAEAEKRLTALAKDYIPLGIRDVSQAYGLKQDQKKYGYSAEEALKQRAGFERINSNPQAVGMINNKFDVNVKSVSEAIPNAREYYNEGCRTPKNIMDAHFISEKLKTSVEMASKIEKVLRDGGKVDYKGKDPEIKKVFDDINNNFNKKENK